MLTEADVSTLLQVAEFSVGHPAALYRWAPAEHHRLDKKIQ